ncbi:MAG: hypothetical protein F6J93_40020 [Oscillatoria sp. SIO1A7]|nr:hypothetical protein [Oscillatoria sp. SIO1A7]
MQNFNQILAASLDAIDSKIAIEIREKRKKAIQDYIFKKDLERHKIGGKSVQNVPGWAEYQLLFENFLDYPNPQKNAEAWQEFYLQLQLLERKHMFPPCRWIANKFDPVRRYPVFLDPRDEFDLKKCGVKASIYGELLNNITPEIQEFLDGDTSKPPPEYEEFMVAISEACEFLGEGPSKISSELSFANSERSWDKGKIVFSSENLRCRIIDWRQGEP